MKTLSNITRIVFFAGIFAEIILLLTLIPYFTSKYALNDEEKKIVKTRLWIMGGVAAITIASAFIGTKAYSKI